MATLSSKSFSKCSVLNVPASFAVAPADVFVLVFRPKISPVVSGVCVGVKQVHSNGNNKTKRDSDGQLVNSCRCCFFVPFRPWKEFKTHIQALSCTFWWSSLELKLCSTPNDFLSWFLVTWARGAGDNVWLLLLARSPSKPSGVYRSEWRLGPTAGRAAVTFWGSHATNHHDLITCKTSRFLCSYHI